MSLTGLIPDRVAKKCERLANASIHELVFVNAFVDQDGLEEALDALDTARLYIDQMVEVLEKLKAAAAKKGITL